MLALPPKPIGGNSSPMPRLEISRNDPNEHATAMKQSLTPVGLVEHYVELLMGPDPAAARAYISPDLVIRFTGGRVMHDPTECAAFNKQRYAWVKKRFLQTDLVAEDIGIGGLFHKAAEVHHVIGHWSSSGSRLAFANPSFTRRSINGYRHQPGGSCAVEGAKPESWLSRATPRPGTSP